MTSVTLDLADGLNSAVAIKGPVRIATSSNISLSGEQTIDGVALVEDDRVLVANQTDATENGIYRVNLSTWTRTKDFSRNNDVVPGTLVYVLATGELQAASFSGDLEFGTTEITFSSASLLTLPFVTPVMFGAIESDPDQDTAGLLAAWTYSRTHSVPLLIPDGTWYGYLLPLYSNQRVIGSSQLGTIIKKPDDAGAGDIIFGHDSYALFNTTPADPDAVGSHNWQISDLTLDGNFRENAATGRGLAVWGRRFNLENVAIYDSGQDALYTEFTDSAEVFGMESYVRNLLIDTTQLHGWRNMGPHDMHVDSVSIIDAGLSVNDGFSGLYLGAGANGRFNMIHPWSRSTATNRMHAAVHIDSTAGLCSFANSHFEGAYTANAIIQASYCSFDSTCSFYAAWNGVNVQIRAPFVTVKGFIGAKGTGRPDCKGVVFGTSAPDNVGVCIVDVVTVSQDAGEIDVTYSQGGNLIRVAGYSTSATRVVGTIVHTDHYDLNLTGSTIYKLEGSRGTWTPNMTFNASSTGVTYGAGNAAFWSKIGRTVKLWGRVQLTNNGSGVGAALITNMPFTAIARAAVGWGSITAGGSSATGLYPFIGGSGGTTMFLRIPGATDDAFATDTNCTDTFDFYFEIEFEVAA